MKNFKELLNQKILKRVTALFLCFFVIVGIISSSFSGMVINASEVNLMDKTMVISGTPIYTSNTTQWDCFSFSTYQYTFKVGDTIEIQMRTNNAYTQAGLDIINTDNTYFRDEADYKDQYGYRGHSGGPTPPACQKNFLNRIFPVPLRMIGKTSSLWIIAVQSDKRDANTRVEFDNIIIKDINGIIVKRMYTNAEDVIFNRALGTNNATMRASIEDRVVNSNIYKLKGTFGEAEIDMMNPEISSLFLRQPDGSLSDKSIINQVGNNYSGGYSYVDDNNDKKFSSKLSKTQTVTIKKSLTGSDIGITVSNIELVANDGTKAPVVQQWDIYVDAEGKLKWDITQHWSGAFTAKIAGMPAIFLGQFSGYANAYYQNDNMLTSTLWYEPNKINSEYYFPYEMAYNAGTSADGFSSDDVCQTIMDKDAWAVYKLFTNFNIKSDVVLKANNGYLFRRGGTGGAFNEIGTSLEAKMGFTRANGNDDFISMTLWSSDNSKTGHQLNLSLPTSEKNVEDSSKNLFGALMNGGVISNQKEYLFGNESEGCNYSGNTVGHGINLFAGLPAPEQLSSNPYDMAKAFKRNIMAILDTTRSNDGLTVFGYNGIGNARGEMVDENLTTLIGAGSYYYTTGDKTFVQDTLAPFEKIISNFTSNIQANGLYKNPGAGAHWYYDAMRYSGYNTYVNSLLYKSLLTISDFEKVAGNDTKAASYATIALNLKNAINSVLWNENAVGGPRYTDWIEPGGKKQEYFVDLCQYSPIVYGIADSVKAQKIIKTAQDRMVILKRDFGYAEYASPTNLWPITDPNVNFLGFPFGEYMNGGSFFITTYYEIVARSIAGDSNGAYYRYKKYLELYQKTHFTGTNGCNMQGVIIKGGEPYLADFVGVLSSMITGILGITPGLELTIRPSLPTGWTEPVFANISHLGINYKIEVNGNTVTKTAINRVYEDSNNVRIEGYGKNPLKLKEDGLLAGWKFEEGAEPAMNAISTFHPGKQGGVSSRVMSRAETPIIRNEPGKFGKSFKFQGIYTDDRRPKMDVLTRFDFGKKDNFTLANWVKVEPANGKIGDIIVSLSKQDNFWLNVKDGKANCVLVSDSRVINELYGNNIIADNIWHHIAMTVDRSTNMVRLYVDGVKESEQAINPVNEYLAPKGLTIGGWSWMWETNPFKGWIDEAGIYNKALSQTELSTLITSGITQDKIIYESTHTYSYEKIWSNATILNNLEISATLNGGSALARVTSLDASGNALGSKDITVLEGKTTADLANLALGIKTKVDLILTCGTDKSKTPVVNYYNINKNVSTIAETGYGKDTLVYNMPIRETIVQIGEDKLVAEFDFTTQITNKVDSQIPLVINWSALNNAVEYRVLLDDNIDFSSPILNNLQYNNTINISNLSLDKNYYLKAIAYTVGGAIETKNTLNFTTKALALNEKAITSFNFTSPVVTGQINEVNKTIALTVPFGTNVTALVPSIAVSANATISPNTGVAQNFTNPVIYTVTAENGTTAQYTVTVTISSDTRSSAKAITSFNFTSPVATGQINEANKTIVLTVPFGTSITSFVPTIVVSENAIVSPNSGVSQNFTNPVVYTVTAQNGTTAQYTVTVIVSADTRSNEKTITSFVFANPSVTGQIDNASKTIALTVPFGTNVTSLIPTIVISDRASISPSLTTPQSFTNPVSYTVTAENGTTAQYIVRVTVAPAPNNTITKLLDTQTNITVEGIEFSSDLRLLVEKQSGDSVLNAKRSIVKVSAGADVLALYDISLRNLANAIVQPNGEVTVSIPVPLNYVGSELKIYYINGENAEVITSKIKDGMIIFKVSHFSKYAIVKVATKAETNAKTGDSTKPMAVMVAVISFALTRIFVRRKRNLKP